MWESTKLRVDWSSCSIRYEPEKNSDYETSQKYLRGCSDKAIKKLESLSQKDLDACVTEAKRIPTNIRVYHRVRKILEECESI